jgi:hypothetical protein
MPRRAPMTNTHTVADEKRCARSKRLNPNVQKAKDQNSIKRPGKDAF